MIEQRPGFTIDSFAARQAGTLPDLLGIRVERLEHGALTMSMQVEPRHLAPNGFLHAASVIAVADTACGYGCFAHLPTGATGFTTIELKSNFLGTALEGRIVANAKLVHGGRSTQIWDAVVTAGEEPTKRTIALFRCTQMVLWPKA